MQKKEKLETCFKCPFYKDDESVEVKMKKKVGFDRILCHTFKVKFLNHINNFPKPLNVY